jgi:hypothetical protein
MSPKPIVSLVLPLLLAPTVQAGVTVVDASSPVPVVQAAVDAAANGVILLVEPGEIDGGSTITIDGKALTLIADGDTVPLGRLIVKNLPAGQQVTVRGFTLDTAFISTTTLSTGQVEVRNCAGSVWIESCTATAPPTGGGAFGTTFTAVAGALVENSSAVVLLRCRLTGGRGGPESPSCTIPGYAFPGPGGAGLRVTGSVVAVHGGELTGGEGGHDSFGACQPEFTAEKGGPGLSVQGSTVHVAGATVLGADVTPLSASPGEGLVVADAGSVVSLRGATVLAGLGPPPVADIVAPPDTVSTFAAPPRELQVSSPVREGHTAQLVIDGQVGELTAIFVGFSGAALVAPGKQGVWALGAPFFGPLLVAANPVGHWVIPFTTGNLSPPSLMGQTYLLQLVVHDGSQVSYGGETAYVLIDSTIP